MDPAVSRSGSDRSRRVRTLLGGLALATVFVLTVFVVTVGAPSSARAQAATTHEVTWAYANHADVARFVVFVSSVDGDQSGARQINVGKPPGQLHAGALLQYFSAIVSVSVDEFVAVGAVGHDGSLSTLSGWSPLPPSPPGQPLLIP